MPASARQITAEDIIPDAEFAHVRKERRASLLPIKRLRRIDIGPHCTFYFESFETMLFQVQEMLLIERGGTEQLKDELAAYNPLIPQGDELVATAMFEIDDPLSRARILGELGGIEDHFYLQVGTERVFGVPEADIERTRDDGKTSSVHFLRFPLARPLRVGFRDPDAQVLLGCDDPRYGHMSVISAESRAELAKDFAE
jgi:hypothetical protein